MMGNCHGRKKMNSSLLINPICAKICILLSLDENYNFRPADILYHLSLADFIDNTGGTKSTSIRNINSVLFYSRLLNDALFKMQLYDLVLIDGEFIRKSYSCDLFVNKIGDTKMFSDLWQKLCKAHELCLNSNNIVETYDSLYNNYLKNKMCGES